MKMFEEFERRLAALLEVIEREEDPGVKRAMILTALSGVALEAPSPFETIGLLECVKDKILFDVSYAAEKEVFG